MIGKSKTDACDDRPQVFLDLSGVHVISARDCSLMYQVSLS